MPAHALAERLAFADTLATTAPDAPTLCHPWTAAQLAAHVILRERSVTQVGARAPIAAIRAWSAQRLVRYAAEHPYDELVQQVHDGPPPWSLYRLPPIRERLDLLEYVVHHEDVRRATDEPPAPRDIPADRVAAIWVQVRFAARFLLRQAPVGVVLVGPDQARVAAHKPVDGRTVLVCGDPVELALVTFGRQRVAVVEYAGDEGAVAQLTSAHIAV
jgi:uncharacterized protein (TIGR03085 family)